MSDSESTESLDVVKDYLESFEKNLDEILFDDFKKVHEKFTKEDYLKFLNLEFDEEICNFYENSAEELYKILLFIYDQLDMSQEEFEKILEDMIIKYLKRDICEFSIDLLEKFYCESKFNFNINKFVIPTLEGLVRSKKCCDGNNYRDFKYSANQIISFLGIHGANFDADEAKVLIETFNKETEDYNCYPHISTNPIKQYTSYFRSCPKCCATNK